MLGPRSCRLDIEPPNLVCFGHIAAAASSPSVTGVARETLLTTTPLSSPRESCEPLSSQASRCGRACANHKAPSIWPGSDWTPIHGSGNCDLLFECTGSP